MRRWIIWLLLCCAVAPVWAARDFNGTTQNAELSTALFTNEAFTVCAWFWMDTNTAQMTIVGLANNGADGTFRMQTLHTDTTLRATKRNDGGTSGAATQATISTGSWLHGCAVYASDTSRLISLNGATFGSDTTSVTDPTSDFTSLAVNKRNAYEQYFDGKLGYVDFWSVALTQTEVTALANRACPKRVRTESHVSSVPLWGAESPELDVAGARSWTLINTPTAYPGPPVSCLGRK